MLAAAPKTISPCCSLALVLLVRIQGLRDWPWSAWHRHEYGRRCMGRDLVSRFGLIVVPRHGQKSYLERIQMGHWS